MFSKRIKWKSFYIPSGKIHLVYNSFMLKFSFIWVSECKLRKLWIQYGYTLRMYCSSPPNLSRFSFSIQKPVGFFYRPMLFIHRATAPAIKPPLHLLQEIQFLALGFEKQDTLPKSVRLREDFSGAHMLNQHEGWRGEVYIGQSVETSTKTISPKVNQGSPKKVLQAVVCNIL